MYADKMGKKIRCEPDKKKEGKKAQNHYGTMIDKAKKTHTKQNISKTHKKRDAQPPTKQLKKRRRGVVERS